MPPSPFTPWRLQFSSTLKSIYVLRYLLFSGGVAIAAALLQRALLGPQRPGLGLLVGLAVGLVVFRGQLRPFSLPVLALGQEHLFFVRKGAAVLVPWSAIRSVTEQGKAVVVQLAGPGPRPDGTVGESFQLGSRDFGLNAHAASYSSGFMPAIAAR